MDRKLLAVLLAASFSLTATAEAPDLINYQALLSDEQGRPMETGEYTLSVEIFATPNDGAPVWGPQVFDGLSAAGHGEKVPVVRGFFNLILGPFDTAGRPLASAFAEEMRYVQVTVGSGNPILPRQQVLSAPYALASRDSVRARHATHADNGVPLGTIVASILGPTQFALSVGEDPATDPAQKRWVLADGTNVAGSGFAEFACPSNICSVSGTGCTVDSDCVDQYCSFDDSMTCSSNSNCTSSEEDSCQPQSCGCFVPDLRAMFLRGHNRGRTDRFSDPGGDRLAGSLQTDAFESHNHDLTYDLLGNNHVGGGAAKGYRPSGGADTVPGARNGQDATIRARGGDETRPNNASVFYYIRVN